MAWAPNVSFDLSADNVRRLQPPAPPAPAPVQTTAIPLPNQTILNQPAPVQAPAQAMPLPNQTITYPPPAPAPIQTTSPAPVVAPAPAPAPVQAPAPAQAMPLPNQTVTYPPAPAPTIQDQSAALGPQPVQTTAPTTPTVPTGAPTTPTSPVTPPATDTWDGALSEFQKLAKDWMAGGDNQAVRTAMNRALDMVGLQNQAQMDALKMQINQDPTLRGQGAGIALLSSMARDQNFKVDDIIGQMSERNLERIVDLQKYGFDKGLQVDQLRYTRNQDLANTLIESGDYAGAAALLMKNAESIAPGMGLNITAESLKNRDPYEINRLNGMISLVKDLARTDPKAATSLLSSMISSNPTLKSWLPEGITADQMISSFVTGSGAANAGAASTLGTAIRQSIADGGDFLSVETRLTDLFKLQNRDATKEGSALSLERINEIRKEEGLEALTSKDDLDEIDFQDYGLKNEFYKLEAKSNEEPWKPLYDMIMSSPDAAKFLDPSLFPGGADAVKNFVIGYSTGLVSFDYDPETGTFVPSASEYSVPWEDPKLYPMFYHMPKAIFNPDGTVNGDYSRGGTSFSETSPKTDAEAKLQEQYAAYSQVQKTSGGSALSAPQWYFATAGGTKPVNLKNIPADMLTGTRSDPNSPLNIGGPGSTTEVSTFDPIKFKTDFGNLSGTALSTNMKDAAFVTNAVSSGAIQNITALNTITGSSSSYWNGIIGGSSNGWIAIKGKPFKIVPPVSTSGAITLQNPDGSKYLLRTTAGFIGDGWNTLGGTYPNGKTEPVSAGDLFYLKPDGSVAKISFQG